MTKLSGPKFMTLHVFGNKAAKTILILLAIIAFIYLIYWLWQRQPKETPRPSPSPNAQNQIVDTKEEDITISLASDDGNILDSADTQLAIKTVANNYIAIISNSFAIVSKTDAAGKLVKDEKLEAGLNLVQISTFTNDFSKRVDKKIALYVKNPKTPNSAKTVLAGSAKNLFQNIITLTTDSGEKKIIVDKSAKVNYPSPPPTVKSGTSKTDQNIRVGDYLIVLGIKSSADEITAVSIDVLRDNKPQIQKDILVIKLLSKVKNNIFSAKNEKDNQIIEFTLNKSLQISKDNQEANAGDIQKDKRAIIIYHTDKDQKIVDLIYLLP